MRVEALQCGALRYGVVLPLVALVAAAWTQACSSEEAAKSEGTGGETIAPPQTGGVETDRFDAGFIFDADLGIDVDLGDTEGPPDAATVDGGGIYEPDAGVVPLCPDSELVPEDCRESMDEDSMDLCNGLDDDCDGLVDEGCQCLLGAVQRCFLGPPGRRGVGGCADGFQQCVGLGEFAGTWSDCEQGIPPSAEICDGLDNDCNGCTDEIEACVPSGSCPDADDPRVPDGRPFVDYPLRGGDFYDGEAVSWSWTVVGGPCDDLGIADKSFELTGADTRDALLVPRLSGDYTVTLTVTRSDGTLFICTWVVHVLGPGLRIEMCYPESSTQDLDLFLKRPGATTPWYTGPSAFAPDADQCDWHNCEAVLRGNETQSDQGEVRADWGYENSDLSECVGGPQGEQWAALGYCANPRLDIDNNLSQGTGLPENINIDAPRDGETFRIMVQNFTGLIARPIVNVYCGGERVATYGADPNPLEDFQGTSRGGDVGAMWRVADVTTHVDSEGSVTCDAVLLQSPAGGYHVTYDDPSF